MSDTSPKAGSLRRHFAWTLAGNVVYAGCQWAILAVIARLTTPEAVGQFALGLAVTAPVFLLAGMQLRGVQATDASHEFAFTEYLLVRAAGMLIGVVVCTAIVLRSGYSRGTGSVILLVGLTKAIEGVSDACYGALQQHERLDLVSRSLMLRGALSVVAVAALLWTTDSLPAALTAMAACWLFVALAHDLPSVSRIDSGRPKRARALPRASSLRRIVGLAFPLGIVLALISLRTNIPRYFLERMVGTTELGIFAALSSLVVAGNIVVTALGQSATSRLAKYHFDGNAEAFGALVRKLVAFGAAVGASGVVGAWALGKPLLLILFGPVYADHVGLLVLLMVGGVFAYVGSFLGVGLTAARHFRVQLPLFATSSIACAAAAWVLVPRHGVYGAATAWILALALELVAVGAVLLRVRRPLQASR